MSLCLHTYSNYLITPVVSFLWKPCVLYSKTFVNSPTTMSASHTCNPPDHKPNSLRCVCWNYLLHDVGHTVIKVLLREDGHAVIVLVLSSIVLDKQLFEGYGALLLIGHHQLVAETKQNELKWKQQTCLKFLFSGTETVRKCCTM